MFSFTNNSDEEISSPSHNPQLSFEDYTPNEFISQIIAHNNPAQLINSNFLLITVVENCKFHYLNGDTDEYEEWFKVCETILPIKGIDLDISRYIEEEEEYDCALSLAIEAMDMNLIQLLLSNGASPNNAAGFRMRHNIINYAINSESMELLKLLIDKGADVNKFNGVHSGRFSSLNHAYEARNKEMLNYLLSLPNISLKKTRLLHTASSEGDIEMVEQLIRNHHSTLDWNFGNHSTPLTQACANQHYEIVKLLLAQPEVDVNFGFLSGNIETPLQNAIRKSNREIIYQLMSHGASFTNTDFVKALHLDINLYQLKVMAQKVSNFQHLLLTQVTKNGVLCDISLTHH